MSMLCYIVFCLSVACFWILSEKRLFEFEKRFVLSRDSKDSREKRRSRSFYSIL